MTQPIKFCAVCGSDKIKERLSHIYMCSACGSLFVAKVTTESDAAVNSVLINDYSGESTDPLLPDVLACAIEQRVVSTSFIQRRFSIGYARSARLMDFMEQAGYISESVGASKPREVIITREKYREIFGRDVDE